MQVYRCTVHTVEDITKTGRFTVILPNSPSPVWVTYVSPSNNVDGGFFAPPTPSTEILVLEVDASNHNRGSAGLYYLGAIVGTNRFLADALDDEELNSDFTTNPQGAITLQTKGDKIDFKSLGANAESPPVLPLWMDDTYANDILPSKNAFLGKGNGGIIIADQKVGGDSDAWMNATTTLQGGAGKKIELCETPAQDFINITTGQDDALIEDHIILAGKQDAAGVEGGTYSAGEFRVDTHGPTNIVSRDAGVEVRVKEGRNIEILNDSTGFMSPSPDSRFFTTVGGGDATYIPEADEIESVAYPPLPWASVFGVGQVHPDLFPPGTGFNPLDKGDESYGCVNIKSEWNNINLEALGPDSVIHISAPYSASKIVITTGGTVDIVATQKVSITSGEKIELNAPFIDINSGIRVDLD